MSVWLLLRGCWHWWFWQAGYWHTGVSRQLLLCKCQLLLSGATYQLSLRRQQCAAKGFVWRQWLYCGGSVPHCWMAVGVYVLYQREQQLVQPVSAGLCNLVLACCGYCHLCFMPVSRVPLYTVQARTSRWFAAQFLGLSSAECPVC
jgi:hypothetical protein